MSDDCRTCAIMARENDRLAAENAGLTHTLKAQAASFDGLKAARTRRLNEEQLEPHVMAILRLHSKLLGSRVLPDGKNADIARTAMKKYTAGSLSERRKMCTDAVRGLALRPYTSSRGRTANPEGATKRHALRYALMDEDHITEHAGFYRATLLKPLEWKDRAWKAAMEMEARYRWLYFQEWQRSERVKRQQAETPGRPQLHLVVDNTEREAA